MADRRRQKWLRRLAPITLVLGLIMGSWCRAAQAVPQGGYAQPEVLIQAEELKALLEQKTPRLQVIDVRHKAKYYLGHIPGALQVWRQDIEDKKQPGLMPAPAQMEKLMGRLGISNTDTLIIYSDQYDHTRLWWLLAYYGFPLSQMKLLDGSLEAWKAKGYPTQLTSPRLKRTNFKLPGEGQRKYLVATLDEVKGAFKDPEKVIIDGRSEKQFLGRETGGEGATRPGHIPGAVWVGWKEAQVLEGPYKGYFKSAAEIKKIFEAKGVTPDKDIYLYSNSSRRATYTLVSLYLGGYPLEKLHLYAASWMEWSRSKEPIETEPARPGPR
jgi:thiosulfate/3-mercaptopyruvate sulfurtransferase